MPRRHPDSRAQQGAPKRFPGEGAPRRRDPLLPGWPLCEPRPAAGAGRPEGWRARGGSEWWQASGGESPLRSPPPRMPPLPGAALQAARKSGLRALLLPPRFLDRAPWTRVSLCPEPGGHGKDRRGAAREAKDSQDSLGALLGQFLPSRFQKFLRQLGTQWVEQLERQTASEPEPSHQRGVSDHWWGQPPPCPSRSFLPDLRCQSSNLQNNLRKVSSHQIPTLGPLRRDCTQFTEARKANNPCGLPAPKLKAAPNRSPLEEASGHSRRCSPFRVRFADETLQDTAFRYWERRCALQQGINRNRPARPAPSSDSLEPVFGSIRRWLENLPNTLDSKPQKRAATSARASWDCPGLPNLGRQRPLSEDTLSSSTQRWRRDHKAFLGAQDVLDQAGKSPCSWSQKLESFLPRLELKRGGPRGYQLFLPSALQ
ncbi:uncharacterized protein C9orf50 homolog isoform X1 [Myotis daubentonii]|uniref:uncharacterized protein C9orf50 homolog isoform X1 n=1 Tax=Myotis daubentonii TaxID=98922 RepID=UPI002872B9D9|nr:uncharacterized protein C9orf50 homolog isoform X1 [Myotis daubentonii]